MTRALFTTTAFGCLLAFGALLSSCSESQGDDGSSSNQDSQGSEKPGDDGQGGGGSSKQESQADEESVECGDADPCGADELCVATRGALCMPLPDPGEQCQDGCVLTEHCCNCTAFSCSPLPDECDDGANCGCVEEAQGNGFLEIGCPMDRSECGDEKGTMLTCILVDFDEDPFAEE